MRAAVVAVVAVSCFACTSPEQAASDQQKQRTTQTIHKDAYDVVVVVDDPCTGVACNIVVDVAAKAPNHINAEYPHKLVFPPNLPFKMGTVRGADGHVEGSFAVDAIAAGAIVDGTLKTSVCSDDRCLIEEVPLKLTLRR